MSPHIEWDNWKNVDEDGEPAGYWKVSQVLYCKLEHIIDGHESLEDSLQLLQDIQELVEAIQGLEEENINE